MVKIDFFDKIYRCCISILEDCFKRATGEVPFRDILEIVAF